MTLILTLANASGVYQSSDYQLTNQETGAPISDRAGSKQLQASFKGLDVRLAFTGIATVGSVRQRTVDWLSAELKALPDDSKLQDICEALANRSAAKARSLGERGLLELILTVATVGEPFSVAVISNVDWRKYPFKAKPKFTIAIHKITKPFHLVSGYRDSVPTLQRHRLSALAKDTSKSPADVLNALADINAIAARHGQGYVSHGCWVTSQVADGRARLSTSQNIGQHPGDIPLLQAGFDLFEWVRKNFRAAPGREICIVNTAAVTCGPGDGTPLPPPTGERRLFTLSGSSVDALLCSPTREPCARLDIAQLESVLEMRCNEEATVPFANMALSGRPEISRAFPKPLLPWPKLRSTLVIDDAAVPRGWEYSVGYWIEDAVHHVIIPKCSRSIRNLAFLGPEDEMVIVAPSTTMEFGWGEHEDPPPATVHARVCWRSRLDGVRGSPEPKRHGPDSDTG